MGPFLPGPGPLAPSPHPSDAPAAATDTWAFVTQSRTTGNYNGSYSLNSSAADERLDAYSPGQVPDNQTPLYSAPLSQTISAFAPNPTLGTDWSNVTQGNRATFSYKGSPSQAVNVFDPATNTFADWVAPPAASRAAPYYRAPTSQLASAWASPVAATDWVASVLSRAAQPYRAPASQIVVAWSAPVVAPGTDWVASILSRATPFYRGSYSLVAAAADEASAPPDAYSPGVIRSLARDYYQAQQSFFAIGWDDHGCTTLFPDTMLTPDTMLFPDLCAQLETAFIAQSRASDLYDPPLSLTIPVYDQAVVVLSSAWAAVTQSARRQSDSGPNSLVIPAFDQMAAAIWATVTQNAPRGSDGRPLSLTIPVFDPSTNTFADWTPGVISSRIAGLYRAPLSHSVLAADNPAPAAGYVPLAQSRRDIRSLMRASSVIVPLDGGIVITATPNMGGGGEWIIWGKPQFPANDPNNWRRFDKMPFRRPTRRVP